MNEQLNRAFQELILKLSSEVSLYQKLENILTAKQSSIIAADVEGLQNIVHEEQRLIPKIRTATRERELRATRIGDLFGNGTTTPSLRELINLAPSHYSRQLIQFREKLIVYLDHIAQSNRENEFLLNSSVELVRGMIQVLLGAKEDESVYYSGQGRIADNRVSKGHLDCQI